VQRRRQQRAARPRCSFPGDGCVHRRQMSCGMTSGRTRAPSVDADSGTPLRATQGARRYQQRAVPPMAMTPGRPLAELGSGTASPRWRPRPVGFLTHQQLHAALVSCGCPGSRAPHALIRNLPTPRSSAGNAKAGPLYPPASRGGLCNTQAPFQPMPHSSAPAAPRALLLENPVGVTKAGFRLRLCMIGRMVARSLRFPRRAGPHLLAHTHREFHPGRSACGLASAIARIGRHLSSHGPTSWRISKSWGAAFTPYRRRPVPTTRATVFFRRHTAALRPPD